MSGLVTKIISKTVHCFLFEKKLSKSIIEWTVLDSTELCFLTQKRWMQSFCYVVLFSSARLLHFLPTFFTDLLSANKKEKGATEVGNPKTEISAPQVFDTFFLF